MNTVELNQAIEKIVQAKMAGQNLTIVNSYIREEGEGIKEYCTVVRDKKSLGAILIIPPSEEALNFVREICT